MPSVRLLLANPLARIIKLRDATWVVSAMNGGAVESAIRRGADDPGALTELADDATIVRIGVDGDRWQTLDCYRTLVSQQELYVVDDGAKELVVTDTFRNALATVPPALRRTGLNQFVDHLAFPYLSGRATHLQNVSRLGRGDRRRFVASTPGSDDSVPQRLQMGEGLASCEEAAEEVDAALASAMARLSELPGRVTMLSGGVDSTLVHSYLPRGARSLSVTIDAPEFTFETDYAREASRLVGSRHELRSIREDEYLARLERIIDQLGFPPALLQVVLLDAVFESSHAVYLTGEVADSVFGPRPVRLAEASASGRNLDRELRQALDRALDDPRGFALAHFRVSSDLSLVREMYGDELVSERLLSRLAYLNQRVEWRDQDRPAWIRHIELGSTLNLFLGESLSVWRQLAFHDAKQVFSPFMSRRLIDAALSIRTPGRYITEAETKPVLRMILSRRVPNFAVNSAKGGTGLPRTRYLVSGPLRGAFAVHELPDFIPENHRPAIERPRWETSWTAFAALTYAIWRDRVLVADLQVSPGTRQLAWAGST